MTPPAALRAVHLVDAPLAERIAEHLESAAISCRVPRGSWHSGEQQLIRELARDVRELAAYLIELQQVLTDLRECEGGDCQRCKRCVTKLYVVAKPAPLAIATQYVRTPWRT